MLYYLVTCRLVSKVDTTKRSTIYIFNRDDYDL